LNGEKLLAVPELRCHLSIPELMNVAKSLGSKNPGQPDCSGRMQDFERKKSTQPFAMIACLAFVQGSLALFLCFPGFVNHGSY
jgi:hypothetical protein